MSLPPWFDDGPGSRRKQINKKSQKQEREHAKKVGGKVQPGSGSSWRAPEDVVGPLQDGEGYLDQLKTTEQSGFRITHAEWERLRKNAHNSGREPRLVIEFEQRGLTLYVTEG